MSSEKAMSYDLKAGLEHLPAFTVRGISAVISNAQGRAADDINALWQDFFTGQLGQRIPERASDVIYAVYSDYVGDHTQPYRLTLGYAVDAAAGSAPGGLYTVQVERGDYASLCSRGAQPQNLIETWKAVWASDLERAFRTDFELYGPRFFEDGIHEVLVYIGLNGQDS
ncbi:MAG: effector binding domain-containing protein [Alphaproteobacteria bacterium]|nr:effector binding domain-containing protein [Alphaproteobacteria bacterium]MBP7758027.1 effector binding domain-containing protein [Alphaproteobacteria bacterium]MBP7761354.1 effector binding domain-containing protein [Alphaproteobacteria bacterium]MBP7904862.1 effector binding domain-containing protein [Alphaproteobacteria bacterium]